MTSEQKQSYEIDTDSASEFGECLHDLLREKSVSVEILANQLSVAKWTIYKWATWERTPKPEVVDEIASALDLSLNEKELLNRAYWNSAGRSALKGAGFNDHEINRTMDFYIAHVFRKIRNLISRASSALWLGFWRSSSAARRSRRRRSRA